jgi:hypothetical protein
MPKDPTKNVDRYKVRGGELNEFDFHQNQEEFAQPQEAQAANLIPGTPPEARKPAKITKTSKAKKISKATKAAKPTKKATKKKKATTGASAKKLAARKAAKKKK